MTPGVRKQKAKQLAGLMEQLDIAALVRNRQAISAYDALVEGDKDRAMLIADVGSAVNEAIHLINTVATEGPLAYGKRSSKLGESS